MDFVLQIVGHLLFGLPELIMGPRADSRPGTERSPAVALGRWLVSAGIWVVLVVGLLAFSWAWRGE